MKTIVFANNKGGCGKTTTALNVAVTLATQGHKVLAVDLDQQGNLSDALGADLPTLEDSRLTSYRMLLDEKKDYSVFLFNNPERPRLDVIPAVLDDEADTLLEGAQVSKELLLRQKLDPARKVYDYCVIDTPPALRAPTLNALATSDLTIVPIEASRFALLGLSQLLRKISKVRRIHRPTMGLMALLSMYTARQTLDRDTRDAVIGEFGEDLVFHATIPDVTAIGKASVLRQAVVEASPDIPAAFAFRKLVAEIIEVLSDDEQAEEGQSSRRSQ
jgi:chromosome partitioning protein